MIQNINSTNRVQKVGGEVQDFKIDPEAQIETLFRRFTEQYSYPISSLIRELTSNATDAHVQLAENQKKAGIDFIEKPVIVKLIEKAGNKQIQFVDSGIGMSKKIVSEVYMEYLKTTKDKTNTQQGCFGMGAKTPMTYLNDTPYQMVTRFNGTELTYMFWYGLNAKNLVVPQSSLVSERPTTKDNGTTISVPILNNDFSRFVDGINEQLPYFKNIVYVGEGSELMKTTAEKLNNYTLYEADTFVMRIPDGDNSMDNHYNRLHAVIDQVSYPIDITRCELDYSLRNSLSVLPIGIRFEIGELTVIDSREQLKYGDDNIKKINERINEFLVEIKTLYAEQKTEVKTLLEYISLIDSKENEFVIQGDVSLRLDANIVGEDIEYKFNSFEFENMLPFLIELKSKTTDTLFSQLYKLSYTSERLGRAIPIYKKRNIGTVMNSESLSGLTSYGIFTSDVSLNNVDRWLKVFLKREVIYTTNRVFILRRLGISEEYFINLLVNVDNEAKTKYYAIEKNDDIEYDVLRGQRLAAIRPELDQFILDVTSVIDAFSNHIEDNVQNLQEFERENVTPEWIEDIKEEQRANRSYTKRTLQEGIVFRNISDGISSSGQRVTVGELINWGGKVIYYDYKNDYSKAREIYGEINSIYGYHNVNTNIGSIYHTIPNQVDEFTVIGCVGNNFKHIKDLKNTYTIDEAREKFVIGKKDDILKYLAYSRLYSDPENEFFPDVEFSGLFTKNGFEKVDKKACDFTKKLIEYKDSMKEEGEKLYQGTSFSATEYLMKYQGWDHESVQKRVANLAVRLKPSTKRELNYLNKLKDKNYKLLTYIRINSSYDQISDVEIEILKRGLK